MKRPTIKQLNAELAAAKAATETAHKLRTELYERIDNQKVEILRLRVLVDNAQIQQSEQRTEIQNLRDQLTNTAKAASILADCVENFHTC